MKLSTRIKKYVAPELLFGTSKWADPNGEYTERKICLWVDCMPTGLDTFSLAQADEYNRYLTKECGCTLLPLNECPVVNDTDIVMHYTSNTYKEWRNIDLSKVDENAVWGIEDKTAKKESFPAYIVTIWNYEYDAWNDPQEKAVFCASSPQAALDEAIRIKKETPSYMVMMSKYIVPANLYNEDAILAAAETGAFLAFEDEDLYIEPEYVDGIDINGNTI